MAATPRRRSLDRAGWPAVLTALLLACFAASGCAAARRAAAPHPPAAPGTPEPAALEAIAARRREAFRGLRATGKLQITVEAARGDDVRRRRLSASQAMLVRAPDCFRLEALTPFGVGYAVATDGTGIAALAPSERMLWRGEADVRTVAAATGVVATPSEVVALLLGVAPVPPLDLVHAWVSRTADAAGEPDDPEPEVLLHASVRDHPDDLVVVGFAHPAAAAGEAVPVLYERSTIAGDLILRARFGAFAPSPAGAFATRVEITARASEAVLRYSTFEVNPPLESPPFSIPTPAGVRELRFLDEASPGGGTPP